MIDSDHSNADEGVDPLLYFFPLLLVLALALSSSIQNFHKSVILSIPNCPMHRALFDVYLVFFFFVYFVK